MKKAAFAFVISTLSVTHLFSQDYTFKVLVNKGKNELKSTTGWQQIKVGSSLKSADEVKIAENSYLGLVHISGKPIELKQAGSYKVTDLAAKVSGGSSVINKYTDFILSENTPKKGNSLVATGAVHRGLGIKVYLPQQEEAIVYNNTVVINWETDKVAGPYIVTFKSLFGDELNKMETKDGSLKVDLYDQKFKDEDNIIVEVTPKDGAKSSPESYILRKLSTADKDRIKVSLKEIEGSLTDPTALNKFLMAGFYEENKLLIDAITSYQEAIQLAPDVSAYKDAYNDFLIRHSIKEPARETKK